MKSRLRILSLLALAAMLLAVPPAAAQYADNPYDSDERDDGIRQSVARVSWFQGGVSFNRGDDPDDWQPASINYPMTLGDRIWAARDARVELQLRGGTVYLAPESELAALDLARDVRQLSLSLGTASFRIRRTGAGRDLRGGDPERLRDLRNARHLPDRRRRARATAASPSPRGGPGRRPPADRSPSSAANRSASGGSIAPDYDVVRLPRADGWDRWVEQARQAIPIGPLRVVRSPRHLRNRRPRCVRLVGEQRGVRIRLVPEGDGRRLGAVPIRTLDLARPVGLDVALFRALGLGAVPLRPLGRRARPLVLGPGRAEGPLSGLRPGRRRLRRWGRGLVHLRLGGRFRRLVPARTPGAVRPVVVPRPFQDERRELQLRLSWPGDGRLPRRLRPRRAGRARHRARHEDRERSFQGTRPSRADPGHPDPRFDSRHACR